MENQMEAIKARLTATIETLNIQELLLLETVTNSMFDKEVNV